MIGAVSPFERETEVAPADVAAALLPLHSANDQQSLAAAIGALLDPFHDAAEACAFLDDGSGTLTPFVKVDEALSQVANLQLSLDEDGPVSRVLETGEIAVLDSLAELTVDQAPCIPARRVLLLPLKWEQERLGVLVVFDQARTRLDLYPCLAEHVALALVRLRAPGQIERSA